MDPEHHVSAVQHNRRGDRNGPASDKTRHMAMARADFNVTVMKVTDTGNQPEHTGSNLSRACVGGHPDKQSQVKQRRRKKHTHLSGRNPPPRAFSSSVNFMTPLCSLISLSCSCRSRHVTHNRRGLEGPQAQIGARRTPSSTQLRFHVKRTEISLPIPPL